MNGYWYHIRQSENPLWYLIYQLSEPDNQNITDYFGNNIISTSAWALSRYPIDMTCYNAYVFGSRPDVIV